MLKTCQSRAKPIPKNETDTARFRSPVVSNTQKNAPRTAPAIRAPQAKIAPRWDASRTPSSGSRGGSVIIPSCPPPRPKARAGKTSFITFR